MTDLTWDSIRLQWVSELLAALAELGRGALFEPGVHPRADELRRTVDSRTELLTEIPNVAEHGLTISLRGEQLFVDQFPLAIIDSRVSGLVESMREQHAIGFALRLPIDPSELPFVEQLLTPGILRRVPEGLACFDWLDENAIRRRIVRSREQDQFLLDFPQLGVDVETYHDLVGSFALAFDAIACDSGSRRARLVAEMVDQAEAAVHRVALDPSRLLPMVTVPYYERITAHHTVNVFLLTLTAARCMTEDLETIRRIGRAAFLFDVGKALIPAEVLHKAGELTPPEAELIMRHPIDGAFLLGRHDGIDPLCVNVAFGHHVKDRGTGYPSVGRHYRIDAVTRLVQVADIFEGLTTPRSHKRALTGPEAFDALDAMDNLRSMRREQRLLLAAIGRHVVGSRVRLPDGRIAVTTGPGHRPDEIEVREIRTTERGATLGDSEWVRTSSDGVNGAIPLDPEAALDLLEAQR
ncbi:MAG: hypothetical protein KDC38_16990 [Planctomycetes bacterium]|nr:hypothetical protein [Planctomycetota bacterium]